MKPAKIRSQLNRVQSFVDLPAQVQQEIIDAIEPLLRKTPISPGESKKQVLAYLKQISPVAVGAGKIIRDTHLNRGTVYRVLDLLEKEGKVRKYTVSTRLIEYAFNGD